MNSGTLVRLVRQRELFGASSPLLDPLAGLTHTHTLVYISISICIYIYVHIHMCTHIHAHFYNAPEPVSNCTGQHFLKCSGLMQCNFGKLWEASTSAAGSGSISLWSQWTGP